MVTLLCTPYMYYALLRHASDCSSSKPRTFNIANPCSASYFLSTLTPSSKSLCTSFPKVRREANGATVANCLKFRQRDGTPLYPCIGQVAWPRRCSLLDRHPLTPHQASSWQPPIWQYESWLYQRWLDGTSRLGRGPCLSISYDLSPLVNGSHVRMILLAYLKKQSLDGLSSAFRLTHVRGFGWPSYGN
jgi:hypothetical protein